MKRITRLALMLAAALAAASCIDYTSYPAQAEKTPAAAERGFTVDSTYIGGHIIPLILRERPELHHDAYAVKCLSVGEPVWRPEYDYIWGECFSLEVSFAADAVKRTTFCRWTVIVDPDGDVSAYACNGETEYKNINI